MNFKSYIQEQKSLMKAYKYGFISGGIKIKTHKNNTNVLFLKNKNIYRKYSFTKEGIKKIEAEKKGLDWYCKKNKLNNKDIIKSYIKKKNFSYIDTKNIQGKKIMSWKSIIYNHKYLRRVLNHYKKFSKKSINSQIHGDLTLDNIIFQKKSLFILDWEFFDAGKKSWGYDIAYLFLSAVCLPFMLKKIFLKKEEKIFKQLWKELIKLKIDKKLLTNPFKFFESHIKKNLVLKKSYNLSKAKFYPFVTNKIHKKKIIEIIKSIK